MANEIYDQWGDFPELLEDLPLDDCPTDALPGTPEKERVMTSRAERRKSIFHPDDARLPDAVAFAPLPMPALRGEIFRGELLQCSQGEWAPVSGQLPRPIPTMATDGPGLAARRERQREKARDPAYRARMAAMKRATRAFQTRQRRLARQRMEEATCQAHCGNR